MKQKWIRPQTTIEKFVPDEYIAVCWGVACDWEQANDNEKHIYHRTDVTHSADNCGTRENQWIVVDENTGIPLYMEEKNTDGLGTLRCNITSGSIETIRPGIPITWETYASGNRTWHHLGYVTETVPGKPNAS